MQRQYPLVRIKTKYQVTLPPQMRKNFNLDVGDLLEVKQEGASIIFTPKALVDKRLMDALHDVASGAVHGPYASAKQMLKALKK